MTEPTDKPPDNERDPTTISTRVWAANEIELACDLIVAQPALLTTDLAAHARLYGPKDGGMPKWLVHGLAAKHFRQWLEQRVIELKPVAAAGVPTTAGVQTITPPPEPVKAKRGGR